MIDLHMHTNYSDGSDSITQLLEKAEKQNLEYISITDHDTCRGYKELEKTETRSIFTGKIIPGIEIKCSYLKRNIEILGYNVNTDKMNQQIEEFYKDKTRDIIQKKYFNLLYEKCIEMGLTLSPKEEIIWNPKNDWASVTIYSDFKKYESNKEKLPADMWEEFTCFTKKYCANPNHILYIDKSNDYPSLSQAIQMVKNAGGLVFLPHLFIYKWVENKEQFINELVENYPIDGIECYYTTFTEEQTKYLLELCEKRKLYKSGGSDYHGTNKKNIELGVGYGNLQVPQNIIEEWL